REPNSVKAYETLGLAYLKNREPEKAAQAFRRMIALALKNARGPYFLGVALVAQRSFAAAKTEFEASLALVPSYVEPLGQLVALAFAEKQPDAALARVKKQIGLAPNEARLHYLLGLVHRDRREAGPAQAALLKAIELDPQLVGPYVQLGKLFAEVKQFDQAAAR